MSQEVTFKCDRCGKILIAGHSKVEVTLKDIQVREWDICEKCLQDLTDWFNGYRNDLPMVIKSKDRLLADRDDPSKMGPVEKVARRLNEKE